MENFHHPVKRVTFEPKKKKKKKDTRHKDQKREEGMHLKCKEYTFKWEKMMQSQFKSTNITYFIVPLLKIGIIRFWGLSFLSECNLLGA